LYISVASSPAYQNRDRKIYPKKAEAIIAENKQAKFKSKNQKLRIKIIKFAFLRD